VNTSALLRAWWRGGPLWCSWQLTRRCSSLCLFCENRPLAAEEELDTAATLRVARELARLGPMFVSLSGGEPFLRSDLAEVVGGLAGLQMSPLLTTHGWIVEPARARDVWSGGLLAATVLLEHPTAGEHDARLGVKGSHARALESLKVLAGQRTDASGQHVNLKVRVREDADVERLGQLLDEAEGVGASVTVEPSYPVAGGAAAGLAPGLLALKKRRPALRSSRAYLARFDEARGRGVGACRAGRGFLNVDHRGRVSQCIEFTDDAHCAGALSTGSAPDVYGRLRQITEGNACRQCWSAARGEVEVLYTLRGFSEALGTLWRR
jgi:MoaA/NifB/PqqE/SkfB family radical SAM enzyme